MTSIDFPTAIRTCDALLQAEEFQKALEYIKRIEAAPCLKKRPLFKCLLAQKACKASLLQNDPAGARVSAERAIALGRKQAAQDPENRSHVLIDGLGQLAEVEMVEGKPIEARELYEEALVLCEKPRYKNSARHSTTLSMLGAVLSRSGDLDQAIAMQLRSVAMMKSGPNPQLRVRLAENLMAKAVKEKSKEMWQEAANQYYNAIQKLPGKSVGRAFVLRSFANCLLALGQHKEAAPVLQAASRIFLEHKQDIPLIETWKLTCKNAMCTGDWDLARQVNNQMNRALKIMSEAGKELPPKLSLEVVAMGSILQSKLSSMMAAKAAADVPRRE